jgi:hypothetical protein
MLPFLHGVRSKQSRGSLTGPEGRANLVCLFVAERLKRVLSFRNEDGVFFKHTFHLVHFTEDFVNCDYSPM